LFPLQYSDFSCGVLYLIGGSLLLLVGSNAGLSSAATLEAMPRFVLARVRVGPGATVSIPLDADLDHGFVHVLNGGGDMTVIGNHALNPGIVHDVYILFLRYDLMI
jgi:hypothetical protein